MDSSSNQRIRNIIASNIRGRGGSSMSSGNKKMIAPKIPQRRIKAQEENVGSENAEKSRAESSSSLTSRGRGRGKKERTYIQTEGILSVTHAPKIKKEREDSYYERASSSRRHKGDLEDNKIDLKKVDKLLESYDEAEAGFDYSNDVQPLRLPLITAKSVLKDEIKEEKFNTQDEELEDIKPDIKKLEVEGAKYLEMMKKKGQICGLMEDLKLSKELNMNNLILFKLPSCLPFENVVSETKESAKELSRKTGDVDDPSQVSSAGTKVANIPNGRIGKLQITKSGKMRLLLGSTVMTISDATDTMSYWEAASLKFTKPEEGNLHVLGSIKRRMVLCPDLESSSEANAKSGANL